ncbi:MAG: hypothetical protein AABX91_02500 [Nanoarchaeota archaeon]
MAGRTLRSTTLSRREIRYIEQFNSKPMDYLSGYIQSYYENRNPLIAFLEDRLWLPEPVAISLARAVYRRRLPPKLRESGIDGCYLKQ